VVGDKVIITDKDSIYYKEWGRIIKFDVDYFHIAIADGNDSLSVFDRDQFKKWNGKVVEKRMSI